MLKEIKISKISPSGQIYVPNEIKDKFKIKSGDKIKIMIDEKKKFIIIKKM
ncbi:MAG: AbrB/MazE/SpoVT family DNA-binding domain-containing protein [Methanosarcinales archaeon]